MYEHLRTIDDVACHLRDSYRRAGGHLRLRDADPSTALAEHSLLADPAPLMRRAVQVSGERGLSVQELRRLFHMYGSPRWKQGVDRLRAEPDIALVSEERPGTGGHVQTQVVFREVRVAVGA